MRREHLQWRGSWFLGDVTWADHSPLCCCCSWSWKAGCFIATQCIDSNCSQPGFEASWIGFTPKLLLLAFPLLALLFWFDARSSSSDVDGCGRRLVAGVAGTLLVLYRCDLPGVRRPASWRVSQAGGDICPRSFGSAKGVEGLEKVYAEARGNCLPKLPDERRRLASSAAGAKGERSSSIRE